MTAAQTVKCISSLLGRDPHLVSHSASGFHGAVYPIDLRVTGVLYTGNCLALLVCAIGLLVEAGPITIAFQQ